MIATFLQRPMQVTAERLDVLGVHKMGLPANVLGAPSGGADNWGYEGCRFYVRTALGAEPILNGEWVVTYPDGQCVVLTDLQFQGAFEPFIARAVNKRTDDFDVYVGRPTKWGNPFTIGKDGTRDEVIEKYRAWLLTQPDLLAEIPKLRGKRLGCWCKPEPCHADVLADFANNGIPT